MEALQKVAGGIGSGLSAVGRGAENAAYYAQLADAAYAGHLPQFLAQQSALLQDPSIRNRLLQDPGLARILGVPVTTPTYPNAPAGFSPEYRQEEFGAAATAPRAQLPPLGAEGLLQQATSRLLRQPGMAEEAARSGLGIGGLTPEQATALGLTVRSAPLRGGGTASSAVQKVGTLPGGWNLTTLPGAPGALFAENPATGELHTFYNPRADPGANARA